MLNYNESKGFKKMNNTYLAINNNLEIRKNSSSGGVFYALAKYVIENNGVVLNGIYGSESSNIYAKPIKNKGNGPRANRWH